MDLYCPRCGEPWDNDTFHEVAQENAANYEPPRPGTVGAMLASKNPVPRTYQMVVEDFYRRGCIALGGSQCENTGSLRAQTSAMLRDLLGGDTDGIAAELEDAEHFGLFDGDDE